MDAMLQGGLLAGGDGHPHREPSGQDRLSAPGSDVAYQLTRTGHRDLAAFGLDLDAICRQRPAIRYCLDWSEQRHHLAGPLGTALTARLLDLDWIERANRRCAVVLTDHGRRGLHDTFGVSERWDAEP